jgi:xylulose-5-phosphate/fructose-6-phosphate phosphoketolase
VDEVLEPQLLQRMDAYWRAANYLSIGQIYHDNPLLHEPLAPEHIKPRLLGHWGTTPGQNFIYVHLALVANTYLAVLLPRRVHRRLTFEREA